MNNYLFPYSHYHDPDIPSQEHLDKLEREYLRANARKNDKELYNVVCNLLFRINRALNFTFKNDYPFTKPDYDVNMPLLPYKPSNKERDFMNFINEFSSNIAYEPPLLTQAYWSLQTDLEDVKRRLATKFEPHYFNFNGDTEKLGYVFEELKGLLEIGTKKNNFIHLFSPIPNYEEWEQLKWMDSNRLLGYFLLSMYDYKLIDKEWQSIAGNGRFFINQRNKEITANDLAKVVSDIRTFSGKPKKSEIIDHALLIFKKN